MMINNRQRLFEVMSKLDESFKPKLNELMSTIPTELDKVSNNNIDKEILRAAIIAEMDAVNLYEQFSELTTDADLKKVLLDIAKEEKTHVGEFESLLLKIDKQQEKELKNGKKEVEDLL